MTMKTDIFYTPQKTASREIKIKGSRFIGRVHPVEDRDKAEQIIQNIARKHHDATHNCTAFRVGLGDASIFRYNDDGEPSGTAGKPILDAIDGRELTGVVCVVTRYFGGAKLGTGGLTRAYGQCASETLDAAGKQERIITVPIRIAFNYKLTGVVMNLISAFQGSIIETTYEDNTRLTVRIRISKNNGFKKDLINATSGRIEIQEEGS